MREGRREGGSETGTEPFNRQLPGVALHSNQDLLDTESQSRRDTGDNPSVQEDTGVVPSLPTKKGFLSNL